MADRNATGFGSFAAWRTAATRPNEGLASSSSKAHLVSSKESSSSESAPVATGSKMESSTSTTSSPPTTSSTKKSSTPSSLLIPSSSNAPAIAHVDFRPPPRPTSNAPSAFKSRRPPSPPPKPEPVLKRKSYVVAPSFLSETPEPETSTPTEPIRKSKPALVVAPVSPPSPSLPNPKPASSYDIASKTHPSYLPTPSAPPTSLVTSFFRKIFGSGSTTTKPDDTSSSSSSSPPRTKPVWSSSPEPPSFLSADSPTPTPSSSTPSSSTPTASSSSPSSSSPPSSSSSLPDFSASPPPSKKSSSKPTKPKSTPIYPPLPSPSEITNLKAHPPPTKKKAKSPTIIPSPTTSLKISLKARRAQSRREASASAATSPSSPSVRIPKSKSKPKPTISSLPSSKALKTSKPRRLVPPPVFLNASPTPSSSGVRRVPRPGFEPVALPRLAESGSDKKGGIRGVEGRTGLIRRGYVGEAAEKAAKRRKEMVERKVKKGIEVVRKVDGKEAPPHQYIGGSADLWDVLLDTKIKGRKPISLEPATDRPPVAQLAHSLDRVLFNPGVHFLRDPRSNVYNFDARIRDLPHPDEFDQKRFPPYVTASKDLDLRELAKAEKCTFYGSTSTLTSCLSQIYFMIGRWRELNTTMLSAEYAEKPTTYTFGAKLPASIFLKYNEDGTYAVDNDKTFETAGDPRILSELGKVMEKLLTTTSKDLARFRKDAPEEAVSEEERNTREAYHYTKGSSLLMRSQLDGVDPRLPGTGSFDIKTRSTIAIRMDMENIEEGRHYPLRYLTGVHESFEKERWDMFRSAFLKYSLQCRIGGMDGIFCAYHSTSVMHGFQYIPVDEMDEVLFGSTTMGDQNFALSVEILEKVFEQATRLYPGVNLEVTMNTPDNVRGEMAVFVQPQEWDEALNGTAKPIIELRVQAGSKVDGKKIVGEVEVNEGQKWNVDLSITRNPLFESRKVQEAARRSFEILRTAQIDIGSLVKCPSGLSEAQMQKIFDDRWYAEVSDPDSGFSHLAVREARAWEEEDEDVVAEEAKEEEEEGADERWRIDPDSAASAVEMKEVMTPSGKVLKMKTVKAKPPRLVFGKIQKDVLEVRKIARAAKAREEELRKKLRGKEVHHWVQGPLFADLEEEEVVEETKEEEK